MIKRDVNDYRTFITRTISLLPFHTLLSSLFSHPHHPDFSLSMALHFPWRCVLLFSPFTLILITPFYDDSATYLVLSFDFPPGWRWIIERPGTLHDHWIFFCDLLYLGRQLTSLRCADDILYYSTGGRSSFLILFHLSERGSLAKWLHYSSGICPLHPIFIIKFLHASDQQPRLISTPVLSPKRAFIIHDEKWGTGPIRC